MTPTNDPVLQLNAVSVSVPDGTETLTILDGVDLLIEAGAPAPAAAPAEDPS